MLVARTRKALPLSLLAASALATSLAAQPPPPHRHLTEAEMNARMQAAMAGAQRDLAAAGAPPIASRSGPPPPIQTLSLAQQSAKNQADSQRLGFGVLGVFAALVFCSPFIWLFWLGASHANKQSGMKAAKQASAGYTPRVWKNPYVENVGEKMIHSQMGRQLDKDFTDGELVRERGSMPRFRLMWCINHHDERQVETGWQWMDTVDGNPSLGSPAPRDMRVFLQHPEKIGRRMRLRLYEITHDIANRLNNGPLREEEIPVRFYPGGEEGRLLHWVGNINNPYVFPRDDVDPGNHGTARPTGGAPPPPPPPGHPAPRDEREL